MAMYYAPGLREGLTHDERETLLRELVDRGLTAHVRDIVDGAVIDVKRSGERVTVRTLDAREARPICDDLEPMGNSLSNDLAVDLDAPDLIVDGWDGDAIELRSPGFEGWNVVGMSSFRDDLMENIAAWEQDLESERGNSARVRDCTGVLASLRDLLACCDACGRHNVIVRLVE